MTERLLTIEEVAELLQVSTDWLYRQVERKRIPAVKLGARVRFRPKEIDAYLDGQATMGAAS